MKLPLNFLFHLTSAGLLGVAGFTFYKTYPETRREAIERWQTDGVNHGNARIDKGRVQGPKVSGNWTYGENTEWWALLKTANFTGKLPPPPPVKEDPNKPPEQKPSDQKPLDQIIELIVLFYDGKAQGKGGNSHVVVRYKPEANVQAPEWYLREIAGATAASSSAANLPQPPRGGPGDVAAAPAARLAGARPLPAGAKGAATPMPATTSIGRDKVQKVWIVDSEGNARRETKLWPPYDNIHLVQVADDAQAAFFVRDLPPKVVDPSAATEGPGEVPKPPEPEKLIKTSFSLSQELLRYIEMVTGRKVADTGKKPADAPPPTNAWLEGDETRRDPNNQNVFHIGLNDQKAMNENPEQLLDRISADSYVSRVHGGQHTRGVRLTNVSPELASRFGVAAGDVIVSVNGESVTTKAEAVSAGKKQYRNGTRTFTVKFLANGQYVERTYQTPNR